MDINGKLLEKEDSDNTLVIEKKDGFSHFYVGSYDNEKGTSVTVTNVLLYNRQLSRYEIDEIQEKRFFAAKLENGQQSLALSPAAATVPVSSANPSVTIPEATASPQLQHLPSKNNEGNLHQTNQGNKEEEVVENGTAHQQQAKMSDGLDSAVTEKNKIEEKEGKDVHVTSREEPEDERKKQNTSTHTKHVNASAESNAVDGQNNSVVKNPDSSVKNTVQMEIEDKSENVAGKEIPLNSELQEINAKEENVEMPFTAPKNGNPDVVNGVQPVGEEANDVVQAQEKEEAALNATVLEAADNTSLRGRTNASNYSDTLRTLLQPKGGDAAVRSCVSLLALLPSLCLWCFLTALHCCQAVAA